MLGAGLLTVGIILGTYLNKWGYIMENIKVEISVSDLHNSYEYMHKGMIKFLFKSEVSFSFFFVYDNHSTIPLPRHILHAVLLLVEFKQ